MSSRAGLQPVFTETMASPRADDPRVLSGITFVNRDELGWCGDPASPGPAR